MVSEDLECDGSLCTFNKLLERLLKNTSIRSLEVLNLSVNQNWELKSSLGFLSSTYFIMMSSASLQHLRIEQDSFCKIYSIQCPELLELQHLDLKVSPQLNCLLHSNDLFFDGFETILDCRACPKIERINTIYKMLSHLGTDLTFTRRILRIVRKHGKVYLKRSVLVNLMKKKKASVLT